ncbi:unnamed protein product [Mytilus coruscus]|uniref:Uncharacterized protein n=1 Tax=Mytilus coruscus TaxID=42192 RepID=A0A6J8AGM3_MYTCO|nr:unnamed protein product [Mytilus coruscus]
MPEWQKTITIPGSNMCELPVIIPRKYLNKPVILEPVSYLENSQLMGACCLVQATRSNSAYVKMQIINPNKDPVTIPRNQVVAMVSHVDIKTLQNLSDVEKQIRNTDSVSNLETKQKDKSKKKSKLDFDLSSAELTDIEKQKLKKFLDSNRNVFATDLSELGQTNIYQHEIQTTHEIPVRTPPYRTTPVMKEEIQKQVDTLLANNIIRPSTSPYNSSVVLVKKKDNSFRFTIDFRNGGGNWKDPRYLRKKNGERRTKKGKGERRKESRERRTKKGEWRKKNGDRRTKKGIQRKENGKRRKENGDRRKENEERSTEHGERRMAKGEQRKEFGDRSMEKGVRNKETGVRRTEQGERSTESGERWPVTELNFGRLF